MIKKTFIFIVTAAILVFALMLSLNLTPKITGLPLVNVFTKPDFEKYPDLVVRTENFEVYDFTIPNKVTYYYNIIETEIPFTIDERNFILIVGEVDFDKDGEEYATTKIISSGLKPAYNYLYENNEILVELFDEKITLNAESIIDNDNIEYLTINGVIEETVDEQNIEEIIEEETEQEEPEPVQPEIIEEIPQESGFSKLEIIFSIVDAILVISLILIIVNILKSRSSKGKRI